LPELYGTIKRIRQRAITIQQIDLHSYREFMAIADKKLKETNELLEWLKASKEAEKKGMEPPPAPPETITGKLIRVYGRGMEGPEVTLSCADSHLVDRALELIGKFCRFEVREGQIVKIEIAEEGRRSATSSTN